MSTELVSRQHTPSSAPVAMQQQTDALMTRAKMIASAPKDMLPQHYRNNPGACLLAVDWAERNDVSIFEALGEVSFVHGRPVVSARHAETPRSAPRVPHRRNQWRRQSLDRRSSRQPGRRGRPVHLHNRHGQRARHQQRPSVESRPRPNAVQAGHHTGPRTVRARGVGACYG